MKDSRIPVPKPGSGERYNPVKMVLIAIVILFLSLIIYIPTASVIYQAFKSGIEPFLKNLTRPDFLNAIKITLLSSPFLSIQFLVFVPLGRLPGKIFEDEGMDLCFQPLSFLGGEENDFAELGTIDLAIG
jgi:hypothetical protein